MTDESSLQPTSGSLSAKVIRKCRVHRKCHLYCPERKVEDLGEIASFVSEPTPPVQPSLIERLRNTYRRIVA